MAYQSLSKLYHSDKSAERDSHAAQELMSRLRGPSTIRTGFLTPCGELFMVQTVEIASALAYITKASAQIDALLQALPPIVQDCILRDLVLEEVVSSNGIEDIRSSKRQVRDAITQTRASRGRKEVPRFAEFALLYESLLSGQVDAPKSPEDIREIYDKVVFDELAPDEVPDGELFRAHGVDVIGRGGKVLHRGIESESAIIEALDRMLEFSQDGGIPSVYRALISHYLFEYIHPFYDGNGRTGRYLLSLALMHECSAPLALSVSRTLLDRKNAYYKAIRTVEEPLNHGELTFYVSEMAGMISGACDEIVDRLEQAAEVYLGAEEAVSALTLSDDLGKKERAVILFLLQFEIFGQYGTAMVAEVADYLGIGTQMARKYLGRLEKSGICERVRKYDPIMFKLTNQFLQSSGLGELRL